MKKSAPLPGTTIPFVWYFLKSYKGYVFFFVVFAIISGLFNVFASTLLKVIIDSLEVAITTPNNSLKLQSVIWPVVLFVVNFEVHNTAWRLMNYINYKIQPLIKNSIIQETFDYVIKHSHQFFQDHMAGKISNNITVLATSVERSLHDQTRHIIRGFVLMLATFIVLYYVHPYFFWCFLVWALLFCSGSYLASRKIVSLVDNLAETESHVSGTLVDSISNTQNIRYFARYSFESLHLLKALLLMKKSFRKKEKFMIIYWTVQGLSETIMLACMLYLLIHLRKQGLVSTGDFALILSLCIEVGFTVWWTIEQIDYLTDSIGKCNQSLKALLMPLDLVDAPSASDIHITKGEIQFDHVSFSYKNTKTLFKDKSVTISPGQKVGLVGYSGGGKTTFVNLILRLYNVDNGCIRIDGQNIAAVTQD